MKDLKKLLRAKVEKTKEMLAAKEKKGSRIQGVKGSIARPLEPPNP